MEEFIEEIIQYATKSPENTNANVLRGMLMELVEIIYDEDEDEGGSIPTPPPSSAS